MDFINRNFNVLKFLIPIVIVALLIPMLPIIIGVVCLIIAVNLITRKLKNVKFNLRKEKIKKQQVNNDNDFSQGKVIDVEYKEV